MGRPERRPRPQAGRAALGHSLIAPLGLCRETKTSSYQKITRKMRSKIETLLERLARRGRRGQRPSGSSTSSAGPLPPSTQDRWVRLSSSTSVPRDQAPGVAGPRLSGAPLPIFGASLVVSRSPERCRTHHPPKLGGINEQQEIAGVKMRGRARVLRVSRGRAINYLLFPSS